MFGRSFSLLLSFALLTLSIGVAAHAAPPAAGVKLDFTEFVATFKHPRRSGRIAIDPRKIVRERVVTVLNLSDMQIEGLSPAVLLPLRRQMSENARNLSAFLQQLAHCSQDGTIIGGKLICVDGLTKHLYAEMVRGFQLATATAGVREISLRNLFSRSTVDGGYYELTSSGYDDLAGDRLFGELGIESVSCGERDCQITLKL